MSIFVILFLKMDKADKLGLIAREIVRCRSCKDGTSGKAVPGEGNPDARVVFLGEAPGRTEAATGRPFVGRSGKLLRQMIREVGLSEDEVYITSPVKYLPIRGTPTKKDIRHGRTHLVKQLSVIEPDMIVLLGATAVYAMLERVVPILSAHGTLIERDGRKYLITLHPAAILRFPKYRPLFASDFEKVKELLAGNAKSV